ncbi:hypothetical protein ACLI09_17985 [Flavobacterium sp. RHBU_24]|uniref:hypothetical protein n=1 Tax=Flavobacterium sp. RHBU_24 TaxID=3391185 RepID=UPI0039852964
MRTTNDFMKNSTGLTKNPLGIIGLFISLIYGFACLVLSTSIENLNSANERLPLIWFIITFPIIILIVFIYLVVNHHEKLYSPSDFRNDEGFIETLSLNKIKEKQQKEIDLLESAEQAEIDVENLDDNFNPGNTSEDSAKDEVDEVEELSKKIKNAERWVVKDLELQYKTLFKTNQRLLSNDTVLDLDAYSSTQDKILVAEIKYWESQKSLKPLLSSIQEYILKLKKFNYLFKDKEVELIIVLVFDNPKYVRRADIKDFLDQFDIDIKLIVRTYGSLLNDYQE